MDDLPGYLIEELLGYGAAGEVWRARDTRTADAVAIKRIEVGDPSQVQAARAEAALLSTLSHPHLIALHEVVPIPGAVLLVLDLADGGSLADLLAQRGRLCLGEVVTALAPVGAALAYAHEEGVVHGDVTPSNILFSAAGLPLLGDLGVARVVGDGTPARSSPAYLDPAVAIGCAPTTASDVFMLAAVALHALTGRPVWTAADPERAIAQAAAGDTGDLEQRLAMLPGEVGELLRTGLAREPHLRSTAAEFALDLRHAAAPVPVDLSAGRLPSTVEAAVGSEGGYRAAHRADDPHADDPDADASGHPEAIAGPAALDARSASAARPALPGRPTFDRPGVPSRPAAAAIQQTRAVQPPQRATDPEPRRRGLAAAPRGRLVAGIAGAILLAAAVGVLWTGRHGGAEAAPVAQSRAAQSPTTAAPATAVAITSADAAGILRRLDDRRERAFATNDPTLLAKVYQPGPLLAQDVALLNRIVPPGCALAGVRTSFSGVLLLSGSGGRLVVTATAVLPPSRLMCGTTPSGTAAGSGPTRLRIELLARDGDYRIITQQRA